MSFSQTTVLPPHIDDATWGLSRQLPPEYREIAALAERPAASLRVDIQHFGVESLHQRLDLEAAVWTAS